MSFLARALVESIAIGQSWMTSHDCAHYFFSSFSKFEIDLKLKTDIFCSHFSIFTGLLFRIIPRSWRERSVFVVLTLRFEYE